MSYGPHTHNPWEHDETPPDDDTSPCACKDPRCRIDGNDATNVNVNGKWFSADCVGLCSHCGQVDDLKAFYRESYGRLRHLRACGDEVNEVKR